jgi:thymidine phosphorylase
MENGKVKMEKKKDLQERTKKFALRIIKMYSALPNSTEAKVLGKQVLRSGTSVEGGLLPKINCPAYCRNRMS